MKNFGETCIFANFSTNHANFSTLFAPVSVYFGYGGVCRRILQSYYNAITILLLRYYPLCMKVMREDAVETDEDEMFLEDGMATNDGLEVGGTASGHVGVELADALLERADVALNLVADAANNAGEDSVVGVRTEKWNNLLLAYLDEREFFGLVFQRGKPHLDSRSDIASEILIVSVDKVVGDG